MKNNKAEGVYKRDMENMSLEGLRKERKQLEGELVIAKAYQEMCESDGWKKYFIPKYKQELEGIDSLLFDFNGFNKKENYLTDRQLACLEYSQVMIKRLLAVEALVKMIPQYEEGLVILDAQIRKVEKEKK